MKFITKLIILIFLGFMFVSCEKEEKELKFKRLVPGYSEEGYMVNPPKKKKESGEKKKEEKESR